MEDPALNEESLVASHPATYKNTAPLVFVIFKLLFWGWLADIRSNRPSCSSQAGFSRSGFTLPPPTEFTIQVSNRNKHDSSVKRLRLQRRRRIIERHRQQVPGPPRPRPQCRLLRRHHEHLTTATTSTAAIITARNRSDDGVNCNRFL